MTELEPTYDLIIVGGNLAGLSVAVRAQELGLERVLVLESGKEVSAPAVVSQHGLHVAHSAQVESIAVVEAGSTDQGAVTVISSRGSHVGEAVVIMTRPCGASSRPEFSIPAALESHVYFGEPPDELWDSDVLVVGPGEDAAELAIAVVDKGAMAVLAMGGGDPSELSRLTRRTLLRLEVERRIAVLWHSAPEAIEELGGHPMAFFGDNSVPDLQFDHVLYRLPPTAAESTFDALGISIDGNPEGRVWWAPTCSPRDVPAGVGLASPGGVWESVRKSRFPGLAAPSGRPRVWRHDDAGQIEELRAAHYNATISEFRREHSDLWRIRVRPDHGDTTHLAGQYATLGLGYWEPRVDAARDSGLEEKWDKLVRRSYSISNPIFDASGYLYDTSRTDTLEFYIVLVPPSTDRIPALTPRLAVKGAGDRIHLGARVAGRYTLNPVTDPGTQIVLLATGTGEAPHNGMANELLRKGHRGPIVSVITVRNHEDLRYSDEHRRLESWYPNYHYLPVVTRDPEATRKIYIQDVIREDLLEKHFGVELDPGNTDVFMCGNPSMIGLPEWDASGQPVFVTPGGVCEILVERGFTLDRRGTVGNVHYEKYW